MNASDRSLALRLRRTIARAVDRVRDRSTTPAPRLPAPGGVEGDGSAAPAIFVIGCFRSGTSLLRRILDSHPRIACPPESKFILPLAQVLRDRSSVRGLDSMGFDRAEVARELGRAAAGFFTTYAAAQGKPRWADKTPDYVEVLPELREMFGADTRFILLYRHGMDVAFSLANPNRNFPAILPFARDAGGSMPVGAARFWVDQNEKIEAFRRAEPSMCHRITFESITEDPAGVLRPLFDFIAEPWDERVLDYHRFPHHKGIEDVEVRKRQSIERNSGNYLAWPEGVQQIVREACEPMLSGLGYA
jgi:protein-tyrosine sulfotransferase